VWTLTAGPLPSGRGSTGPHSYHSIHVGEFIEILLIIPQGRQRCDIALADRNLAQTPGRNRGPRIGTRLFLRQRDRDLDGAIAKDDRVGEGKVFDDLAG